jgi:hypothetical protein
MVTTNEEPRSDSTFGPALFFHSVHFASGTHQLRNQWDMEGCFEGLTWPEVDANHSQPSSVELMCEANGAQIPGTSSPWRLNIVHFLYPGDHATRYNSNK